MEERITYEIPSHPTDTAVVGLSHCGSRVASRAAAANRKIRRREASQCGQPYSGPGGVFAVVEQHDGHRPKVHYVFKKKIIFASFLALLLSTGCRDNSRNNMEPSKLPFFVSFENYYNNKLRIPELLLEQFAIKKLELYDTLFCENNREFDTIAKVESELFELLAECDVINGWAFHPDGTMHEGKTRSDFIRELKQERKLYYLGEIPVSRRFRSWVLLSNNMLNNYEFHQYELFIVNMQNQFVKSIIRVHDYCSYWGDSGSTMTIKEGENLFLQKQFIESSDNIVRDENILVPDDEGNYPYDPAVRFRFDRSGYVEIVECIEQGQ